MDLTFSPLTAEQWPALADLFGRAGASNGCWCMYWRIGPRYRDRPREDNKHDLERLARSGRPPGLSPSTAASASAGVSLPRAPTWTGWPAAGTSGRWMSCPCGRSRVFTCGARTAVRE
jgi:hypothetical protein